MLTQMLQNSYKIMRRWRRAWPNVWRHYLQQIRMRGWLIMNPDQMSVQLNWPEFILVQRFATSWTSVKFVQSSVELSSKFLFTQRGTNVTRLKARMRSTRSTSDVILLCAPNDPERFFAMIPTQKIINDSYLVTDTGRKDPGCLSTDYIIHSFRTPFCGREDVYPALGFKRNHLSRCSKSFATPLDDRERNLSAYSKLSGWLVGPLILSL